MKHFKTGAAIALALGTASCATYNSTDYAGVQTDTMPAPRHYAIPPMDPNRTVIELDCGGSVQFHTTSNLRCAKKS